MVPGVRTLLPLRQCMGYRRTLSKGRHYPAPKLPVAFRIFMERDLWQDFGGLSGTACLCHQYPWRAPRKKGNQNSTTWGAFCLSVTQLPSWSYTGATLGSGALFFKTALQGNHFSSIFFLSEAHMAPLITDKVWQEVFPIFMYSCEIHNNDTC